MNSISPLQSSESLLVSPTAGSATGVQLIASGRRLSGDFDFSPRAAGVGKEQFDKLGFDRVGPYTQLQGSTRQQADGRWRTEILVPYGDQLGANSEGSKRTDIDRFTTLTYVSEQPPTSRGGALFISGREISGDFLELQLAKLNLPLPNYANYAIGGSE